MKGLSSNRRPRIGRRALATARRAVETSPARSRIGATLARCSPTARRIAALLLIERLSPAEAAAALEIPVREVRRTYSALLAELRRMLGAERLRPPGPGVRRPRLVEIPLPLRRVS